LTTVSKFPDRERKSGGRKPAGFCSSVVDSIFHFSKSNTTRNKEPPKGATMKAGSAGNAGVTGLSRPILNML